MGTEFQTITIPKGTLLFRGLQFENEKRYMTLFNDLIGYQKDKYYAVAPTMNVFFYPSPYVSDSVRIYDTHVLYITQYDIELLLLLKPSIMSRSDKVSTKYKDILETCSNISENDKCGHQMSAVDPCFTDNFRMRFPQIDGYIGIAEQDAALFTKKYQRMYTDTGTNKVKQIIPSILTDSRNVTGVPEIVIHPLRFRYDDCHLITDNFYSPKKIVEYCIKNRAQYNFFPLLYFSNNGVFEFNALKDVSTIKLIAEGARVFNSNAEPKIYNILDKTFSQMLDSGYNVNNINYKVFVDVRTGFYRLLNVTNKLKQNQTRKQYRRNFKGDIEGYINSYSNPEIQNIVSTHKDYMDILLKNLHSNGYSIKKKLILNRGDKNKFIYNYYIDKVIDRPELEHYKNIRKKKQNQTRKNMNNHLAFMLSMNGISPDNINNMNNENNIFN